MKRIEDIVNKIHCADCLEFMKKIPAKSIDMAITSPPYWGLRDYGTGPNQLGLEPTPEMYIEHLTEIFSEVKRVLKKEGALWLNIGDTYQTGETRQTGRNDTNDPTSTNFGGWSTWNGGKTKIKGKSNLQPKCLCMIPERLAWSLIQNGWILRNKIIWYKPNAMPSSVTDRFSNRWEFVFMFSKSQRYYFDLDAVREPLKEESFDRYKYPFNAFGGGLESGQISRKNPIKRINLTKHDQPVGRIGDFSYTDPLHTKENHPLGKNPGDVFEINTQPFPEAHFAVFPEKLCEKPIKAGCPEEVCKKCGKARERIIEIKRGKSKATYGTKHIHAKNPQFSHSGRNYEPIEEIKTTGWTSCKCNAGFEGGIVLDPFAGAGTALLVAKEMRRRFIGIDIKREFVEMCEKRLAQGVL